MTRSTDVAARGAAFWICYAVTVISAGSGVVYAIGRLSIDVESVDTLYLTARTIALLVIVLVTPLFRWDDALLALAAVMTIVQGIDTFIGSLRGDLPVTVGAAVLCLATIVSATFLARSDRVRGRG